MGLEDLRAALEAQVAAQAEETLRQAHLEAGRIRHAAEAEEARRLTEAVLAAERELRRETAASVARALRAARARVLEERERVLAAVEVRARARLPAACASEPYLATLAARARRLLSYVAPPAQLLCTPGLSERLRSLREEMAGIALVEDERITSGLLAISDDGSVEVDGTLEGALQQRRGWLRVAVVRRVERGL